MKRLAYAFAVAAMALSACYNPNVQSGFVQCSSPDKKCPEGFTCFPDNKCYTTGSSPTCNPTCTGATRLCDTTILACVVCLADNDCGVGQLCLINATDHRQNQCRPGCSASHPTCADDAGACDVDMGVCRGCVADAECTDPANPRCDVPNQKCVACLPPQINPPAPDNCGPGQYCNQATDGSYACTGGCKDDTECPLGSGIDAGAPVDAAPMDLKGADLGGVDMMPPPKPTWACCNHACFDTTKASDNCGACGNACAGTTCCSSACVDTTKDANNCGSCGNHCNLAHATSTCAGNCKVTVCASGYANCNSADVDGCEISVLTDVNNCGACKHVCPGVANGTAACKNGSCVIGACNTGFTDCDGSVANGCETNTGTDVNNCGACKVVCPMPSSGTSSCSVGKCGLGSCTAGFADCDGNPANGCETNTLSDVNNCGACKTACTIANGAPSCASGKCAVGGCNTGFADCDASYANGCETNTTSDANNCGACKTSCGGKACCSSACVDTTIDFNNCGGCKTACQTGQTCTQSMCKSFTLVGTLSGTRFYKVQVSGPMTDTNVYSTCITAGLHTPCQTNQGGGCTYNDTVCTPTPENSCGSPMYNLSIALCGADPRSCAPLNGVFQYMGHHWGSDDSCGAISGMWCASGHTYSNQFALCVP